MVVSTPASDNVPPHEHMPQTGVADVLLPVLPLEQDLARRARRDWMFWAAALLLVIVVVGASRWGAYGDTRDSATARLDGAAQALQQVLNLQLLAVQRLVRPAGDDLALQNAAHAMLQGALASDSLAPLLNTALYDSDMQATLEFAGGRILARAPTATPAPLTTDVFRSQRTWAVPGLVLPLRLTLLHDGRQVLRLWRERTLVAAAVWGTLFGSAALLIVWVQRRRRVDLLVQRSLTERLRQVVRSAHIGVFEHDLVNDVIHSTPEHHAVWGFDPGEVVGLDGYRQRLHPEDADAVRHSAARCRDPAGDGVFDSQHRIVWPDGQVRWIEVRSQTVFEGEGALRRPVRTVGGVTDITAARVAQERLRQQAALLDQAQDAIIVRQLDGRISYWNGGAERIYGWTAAEAIGRDGAQLLHLPRAMAIDIRDRLLAEGAISAVIPERCKDGRTVQMEGRFTLMCDDQGHPQAFFSIKTDVTRRLELEAQLRQAQRLEAVGQLTGGVAHDFNNLLTVILGNVDLLAEQLADRPPLLRLAEMARTAAQRGAELTHGLLAFARRQPLQAKAVDVNETLTGMEGLLRRTLREDVELELVRGAALWPALIDPAQLESAVLNLVLNARDAMPEGGKITLETRNAQVGPLDADRHTDVSPGQYVQVTLVDTGQGMTPEQLARAFEPFFTTKGVGKGSGLGLSMVYGFVKQSQGHIKLDSTVGRGTTVRLYLPRSEQAPPAESAKATVEECTLRGHELVLVVEDDEGVRGFANDVLLGLGYTVLLAQQGPQALKMLRERDDVALLFTDVVMPGGLNGWELAQQATALQPGLKLLFTSGYSDDMIDPQCWLEQGLHLLPKPYRSIDLARKLRTALDGG